MNSILFIGFLFLSSCATNSSSEKQEPEDVAMERSTPNQIERNKIDGSAKHGPIALEHGEKIEWQKFFEPQPDSKQKSKLEERVTHYQGKKNTEDLLKAGRIYMSLGLVREAESLFKQGLRKNPDHIPTLLDLSQLYIRRQQTQNAFDYLAQTRASLDKLENPPKDEAFRYKYVLALAYLQRGEREKGQQILSDLIALEKSFIPGYAALAGSYLATGRIKVAEFIAKRGIDSGKDDPSLLNILGVIENQKGNDSRARQYFDDAIVKNSDFVPALVNRANLNIKRLEFMPAEADLNKCITIDPENVEALIALGIVQKKTGRIKAAKSTFERAIDANPESGIARFNLGSLYFEELGDRGEALRLFNEVLQVKLVDQTTRNLAMKKVAEIQGRKSKN